MQVYRQMTPHYPLVSNPQAAIYQAFTVGRVRFVMTDTRKRRATGRRPERRVPFGAGAQQRPGCSESPGPTGMGSWCGSTPIRGLPMRVRAATPGRLRRGASVIADAIAEHGVDNLLMVSGDAHMLAFDDGTNTDYSASQDAGFPLFHVAAVDRRPERQGRSLQRTSDLGGGQFGTIEVRDQGAAVELTLSGWNWSRGGCSARSCGSRPHGDERRDRRSGTRPRRRRTFVSPTRRAVISLEGTRPTSGRTMAVRGSTGSADRPKLSTWRSIAESTWWPSTMSPTRALWRIC